jgi:hypothetical protein
MQRWAPRQEKKAARGQHPWKGLRPLEGHVAALVWLQAWLQAATGGPNRILLEYPDRSPRN